MKKAIFKTIAAVTAGTMMLGMVACNDKTPDNPNNPDNPDNPNPPAITNPTTVYERADFLARAVDDHYVSRSGDQLYCAGYYNALEGGTEDYANCYEYSSLITMANKLYEIAPDEESRAYYKQLVDDYVAGLENFTGSGGITSTHGRYEWEGIYCVPRKTLPDMSSPEVDMVYDDLMWIIRDFCEIYRTTGDAEYITRAEYLTKCCLDGWDSTKGGIGGIVWGPPHQSKHTCSNGPLINSLCELAEFYKDKNVKVTAEDTVYVEQTFGQDHVAWENMVGWDKYDYYLYWAKEVYSFTYSYLRAVDYTFADNLRHAQHGVQDKNAPGGSYYYFDKYEGTAEGTKFTYNTGSMISGAAWIYRLTGEENYLVQARLMAEGAYNYFVKTVTVDGKEMQMYDCRASLLFNEVLMQGYLDLADASKLRNPSVNADVQKEVANYIKVFKTSINYGFENNLINRTLPQNYLQGWLYSGSDGSETFDTHKDVKNATATPAIMAMIALYETNHGEIK